MTQEHSGSLPFRSLLVPAVVTLAVTLLRLTGELMGGPRRLFGDPGGGGAIVGIVWLVPVFGAYFAWKLARSGPAPRAGSVVGYALLAVAIVVGTGLLVGMVLKPSQAVQLGVVVVAAVAAAWIACRPWPGLGKTLFLYGLLARIPVAIVMLVAIFANWRTHYSARPPDFPEMGPLATWVLIGLLPQMLFWIPFTVIVGMLFGGLALLVAGRERQPATA